MANRGPSRVKRECIDMVRKVVTGFLLLALLFTVGCSPRVGPDKVVRELLNGPDKVVRELLDASIKSDWETVYKLTGGVDA